MNYSIEDVYHKIEQGEASMEMYWLKGEVEAYAGTTKQRIVHAMEQLHAAKLGPADHCKENRQATWDYSGAYSGNYL